MYHFRLNKLITIALALITFAVFPVTIYAQETPAPPTDALINLPNDLQDQPIDTSTDTTTPEEKALTQREEFITGVGVGVVFGIIAGGAVVWFTKK